MFQPVWQCRGENLTRDYADFNNKWIHQHIKNFIRNWCLKNKSHFFQFCSILATYLCFFSNRIIFYGKNLQELIDNNIKSVPHVRINYHSGENRNVVRSKVMLIRTINANKTTRSRHSQECKDPRWQCCCDSWLRPLTFWSQNKWVSRTHRGTFMSSLVILAASVLRCRAKNNRLPNGSRLKTLPPRLGPSARVTYFAPA